MNRATLSALFLLSFSCAQAQISRNNAVGSATVSVALPGVPPANPLMISSTPNGSGSDTAKVFGETPKTAVETTALPKATASLRLSVPAFTAYLEPDPEGANVS